MRTEVSGIEHFFALRDDGRPGLIFSAHLANWELPAICAARFGLDATAVFRPPNNPAAARLVQEVRRRSMGGLAASKPGAVFAMRDVVENGGHLGQLIDQHFTRGVVVTFLGRPCLANPLLAKLARHYDCPVHGVRVVRLPEGRFRLELTPPLDLPRAADGTIDVAGAMQAMTAVVEGWVRENSRASGSGCIAAGARTCCRRPGRRTVVSQPMVEASQANVISQTASQTL